MRINVHCNLYGRTDGGEPIHEYEASALATQFFICADDFSLPWPVRIYALNLTCSILFYLNIAFT